MAPLLRVVGLQTSLFNERVAVRVVNGVSFNLEADQTLAIVGESGCGKSMTALSILRLLPRPAGRITAGRVELDGRDLVTLSEAEMRAVRGDRISMIFQEPMTALNPVHTVGMQIVEALRAHRSIDRAAARKRAIELLDHVGISEPHRRVDEYPHRLSGGMRQRAMIAIALACEPRVLLADEPTTALDVTIQAQVLDLLARLRREHRMGVVLITHDLGVVAEIADRVIVMYAGYKVEETDTAALFRRPLHPYTQGLMQATPRPVKARGRTRARLREIAGTVPSLAGLPPGCPFAPRCDRVQPECRVSMPPLRRLADGHEVACFAATSEANPA
jgi:oligopeptide/dipeptide ABC transporter ATP-binding protein